MASFGSRTAATLNPLEGLFAPPSDLVDTAPPFAGLAGFDVIVQFSQRLIQAEVIRSLTRSYLSPLSAFVPWGLVPLPPPLLATLPGPFRMTLSVREARLELRLVDPYVAGFHWPVDILDVPDGPVVSAAARTARVTLQQRVVDIGWRVELNVLTAKYDVVSAAEAPASGGTTPASPLGAVGWSGGAQLSATVDAPAGSSSGVSWDRFTLATGQAHISARAELVVASNLWRFGMNLDFSEAIPALTADAPALGDFLATDAGKNMMSQAVAPLKAATGVKLTPYVAPGGPLSASTVQRANLPPFHVRDLLLSDGHGKSILCLCAQLGAATGGVARMVQSLPAGEDFAYGVSTDVLSPALKVRWNLAASGFTIVGNAPVDLPVNNDAHHTAPGIAQLQVSFSNILDDVTIQAATDNRGDPLRLLSKQRIQLLNLWDQDGKRVTDLGPLAEAQDMPLILPINFFDRDRGAATGLQANFKDFLFKLMAIIVFPILEPFQPGKNSVTGFSSSAMKAMVVRWRLKSPLDDLVAPISGNMEAQL
jgi:hypothetical protein